jgi:hypothetical protein
MAGKEDVFVLCREIHKTKRGIEKHHDVVYRSKNNEIIHPGSGKRPTVTALL